MHFSNKVLIEHLKIFDDMIVLQLIWQLFADKNERRYN